MAVDELLVGALTAATALGASFLTGRGAWRAALAQARTTALLQAAAQERERRRATYRDMLTAVHAFMEVCWSARPDRSDRQPREQIRERMGRAAAEVTRATREVLLDGPAAVSAAAEQVRLSMLRTEARFADGSWDDYERAYDEFRNDHAAFIELARAALEVGPPPR
ncbi:hypothetical protein [Actinoplanes sp. NPDC023714]|uniref:hypothetical protein n=1 Tax=Actinoplanes sp. NPDC023714 TaxID=3154322 RepID=UPI0033FD2105